METKLAELKRQLAKGTSGILENTAKEHGLSMADAVRCLPEDMWRESRGDRFDEIIRNIPTWGSVMSLVNTGDMIFEVKGPFPEGSYARGYYNLRQTEGGFSGHIKADSCDAIFFLKRSFSSKVSVSINFMNANGDCYLKIFVGRDEDGHLKEEQLEKFDKLANWQS
ncbi:heme utilization cystosolic carrier protein HutX [Pseudovibrio sp. Tun.PSC04-5.I4]|uniref:heme utilization cystosolic carrier protein HutX n=1 Tax=Pseudovibrio sp. Tun.PSC04-5.I4 TaxID=1798213 RepID=UPI0008900512|nr:heme utilization cystosolic carrier protein HutX [Pseudovibrio sp. Tun.PSC04-5.I4]SDR23183.1 heme utilization protein HuvX [Pseudovibrio sp. Tun.PSC04-5.I4]